jgi:hypothetical protein
MTVVVFGAELCDGEVFGLPLAGAGAAIFTTGATWRV